MKKNTKEKTLQEKVQDLISNGTVTPVPMPYHSILPMQPCPTCGTCPTCGRKDVLPMMPIYRGYTYTTSVQRADTLC